MTGSLQLQEYPGEIVRLSCPKCARVGLRIAAAAVSGTTAVRLFNPALNNWTIIVWVSAGHQRNRRAGYLAGATDMKRAGRHGKIACFISSRSFQRASSERLSASSFFFVRCGNKPNHCYVSYDKYPNSACLAPGLDRAYSAIRVGKGGGRRGSGHARRR
jgi:hypothetical protein